MLTGLKMAVKTQILARSVPLGRKVEEPVVVAGMFRTASGLGRSARACIDGLRANGVGALAVDLSEAFNQVDLPPDPQLVPMPLQKTGTLILHANWQETVPALMHLGLRRWHAWRIVGYWAWELEEEPHGARAAAQYLSEIWTCSPFCADAFSRLGMPVRYVPHRVFAPDFARVQTGTQTCLVMADGRSSFDRKNVLASVDIFREALGRAGDWSLIVKCRNLGEHAGFAEALDEKLEGLERVCLVTESLSAEALQDMVSQCDIVLSAHRSEGFGLHLAEAMAMGKCILATGWSGNLAFMTPQNSVLLPYELVEVSASAGIYSNYPGARWAEVDVAASAKLLAEIAGNPSRRQQIGARAAEDVARLLDGSAYASALKGEPEKSKR